MPEKIENLCENPMLKYVLVIARCRVQYEKYFSSKFFFRHISRAEGEWNIGNKIYEKYISILHEAPCDNWFIATLQNITQFEPHTKT